MIKTDFYMTRPDGVNLYRTYSDAGLMIEQNETGALYEEAVDVEGAAFTYTETDVPIDEEITAEQALNILLGGSENEEGESDQI